MKMMLSHWLKRFIAVESQFDREISGVINDNREVQAGDCFVAMAGLTRHGKEFISDAIEKGAVAVLCEATVNQVYVTDQQVPVFEIENLTQLLPELLHDFYREDLLLPIYGVTGTNGKSSVAGFVAQLARMNQSAFGIVGTLGRGVWPEVKTSQNTTPELTKLLRDFSEMKAQNANGIVMEVSSHGISEGRVQGIEFDTAVFTNLSRDHLDYHGSIENYFSVKRRLFLSENLQHALINIDDEFGRQLYIDDAIKAEKISYGFSENADVRVTRWSMQNGMLAANIQSPWGEGELILPLAGKFNLSNALAAISLLVLHGFDYSQLLMQASQLQAIDGRMETYLSKDKTQPTVVVDFAHTPDALSNVLQALREQQPNELGVVFGCGGDRDQGKREMMGKMADQFADRIWITSDNPRSESPEKIIEQVKLGVETHSAEIKVDRTNAIQSAVNDLTGKDLLLLAGKGHEDYQEVAGTKHPYSDAAVIIDLGYRKAGANA